MLPENDSTVPTDVTPTAAEPATFSGSPPRWRRVLRSWPFAVPVIYLGLIFCLQPASRLGDPERAPWLGRLFYDDYDATALALRGLNAQLGRLPGRPDDPCTDTWNAVSLTETLATYKPLEPRFFLEYPHAALWLFRLEWLLQGGAKDLQPPAAVLDACQKEIVEHEPEGDAESALWLRFRRAIRIHETLMVLCLLALMAVTRVGFEPASRPAGQVGLFALPAMLYFALNRFDVWPALLTAMSLACLGRQRFGASGLFLGAATMTKVYPILLAPFVVGLLWGKWRALLIWSMAFAVAAFALFLPALIFDGWEATWAPYRFQMTRTLEGLTLYGVMLPNSLGQSTLPWTLIRPAIVGSTILALALWRPTNLVGVMRRAAIALIVFISLQLFYSPQWIVWLAPLLIPLAAGRRWLTGLYIAFDVITYLTFPIVYDRIGPLPDNHRFWDVMQTGVIGGRGVLLAGLVAVLLWEELRARAAEPPARQAKLVEAS